MKLTKHTAKITLTKQEADTLVKASIILENLVDTIMETSEDFTLVDYYGAETSSNDLYNCNCVLNDFIINYNDNIKDTTTYEIKYN